MTALFRNLLVLLVACLASVPMPVRAQGHGSTSAEGALFLLLPIGAKGVALFFLYRGDNVAGTGTAISTVLAQSGLGAISASYFLHDVGNQDLTDSNGNFLGTLTVRNHLGVVSAAARLLDWVNAGVNFKVVQFRTACRGTACRSGHLRVYESRRWSHTWVRLSRCSTQNRPIRSQPGSELLWRMIS